MAENHLVIINKELQGNFSFHGETVTIHPIARSTFDNLSVNKFSQFSLLDDPNVTCVPSLELISGHYMFKLCFTSKVSLNSEYEISLYYLKEPCKLIHVRTANMSKISEHSIFQADLHGLSFSNCKISGCSILCTKICRKDIPYIFEERSSTLHSTQITDCTLLFENNALTNFKIIIEDREFWVHKEILAAKSPVFLAMFDSEMKEKKENQMIIKDIDSNVFQEMLRYIYSNTVKELETHAEKLLKAADKYDIPKLKLLCDEELSRSLNIENAIHLLELADEFHESTLKKRVLKFIQSNIEQITQTENYKTWRQTGPPYLIADIMETIANLVKKYSGVTY